MRRSLCSGTVHSGNWIAALRTQSRHFYPEGGSNMLNVKNPGPQTCSITYATYCKHCLREQTMLRLALFILYVICLNVYHVLRNELFIIRSKSMCLIIHNIFITHQNILCKILCKKVGSNTTSIQITRRYNQATHRHTCTEKLCQ